MNPETQAAQWLRNVEPLAAGQALEQWCNAFPGLVVFSSSFSNEDQVITDLICRHSLKVEIFTLDTGRLFSETYGVWSRTIEKYKCRIQAFHPQAESLRQYTTSHGPNAFYTSVELRKACCHIRKVAPLGQALAGRKVWVTGLRAAHSPQRENLPMVEWDASHAVFKYHPLLHWSDAQVKEYIQQHQVPFNPLHERGFASIGCAPCTRAIKPGEDFRAGRWWWESGSTRECGLHNHNHTS